MLRLHVDLVQGAAKRRNSAAPGEARVLQRWMVMQCAAGAAFAKAARRMGGSTFLWKTIVRKMGEARLCWLLGLGTSCGRHRRRQLGATCLPGDADFEASKPRHGRWRAARIPSGAIRCRRHAALAHGDPLTFTVTWILALRAVIAMGQRSGHARPCLTALAEPAARLAATLGKCGRLGADARLGQASGACRTCRLRWA